LTDSVALISPYSNHTIVRTLNYQDGIYASANGSTTIVSISQNSINNYTGTVTLGVNSSATPAAVGGGEVGPGIGQIPPSLSNFSFLMGNFTNTILLTTTTTRGVASTLFVSFSTILFALLLHF
jgi:hypothetical protein